MTFFGEGALAQGPDAVARRADVEPAAETGGEYTPPHPHESPKTAAIR